LFLQALLMHALKPEVCRKMQTNAANRKYQILAFLQYAPILQQT